MAISVFQRVQVKDFDSWLNPNPEEVFAMMKEQGALSVLLTRNLEDPNSLMIHMDFPDESTAKSFMEWYDTKVQEWTAAGYTSQDIKEWWLGTNVDSHSGSL
jgi:hypothetical protein